MKGIECGMVFFKKKLFSTTILFTYIFLLGWHLLKDRGLPKWRKLHIGYFYLDFTLKIVSLQVVDKLNILVGASYFENICSRCHLSSLTNQDARLYCYTCKAMVPMQTQAWIACKFK
jgi:hypothetical protein